MPPHLHGRVCRAQEPNGTEQNRSASVSDLGHHPCVRRVCAHTRNHASLLCGRRGIYGTVPGQPGTFPWCHNAIKHTVVTYNFVTHNSLTHNSFRHNSFAHNSFTHNSFTQNCFTRAPLEHTILSRTTFSHATLSRTHTHNSVTRTQFYPTLALSRATLWHTALSRTTLPHATHPWKALSHTNISHAALLYTTLSHTALSFTAASVARNFVIHLFPTQPCHIQPFTPSPLSFPAFPISFPHLFDSIGKS